MTPEERALLERIAKQVDQNNDMLRSIVSTMRWQKIWRFIYWVLIIGTSIGAYWVIQPYINQILSVYSGAESNVNSVRDLLRSYTNQ
jgi:hypothetical protein